VANDPAKKPANMMFNRATDDPEFAGSPIPPVTRDAESALTTTRSTTGETMSRPCSTTTAPAPAAYPLGAPTDPAGAARGNLLTPAQAGEILKVKTSLLERWRSTGGGPRYIKLSAKVVRYSQIDIDAFVIGRVMSNTAQ